MNRRDRRLTTSAVVLVSLLAHAGLLTLVALHSPVLRAALEPGGPPVPVIPVLIAPRAPPPPGVAAPPQPIRLHRRAPRAPLGLPQPEPLPAPPPPAEAPPPPLAAHHPAPQPLGPSGNVAATLRRGVVGCANPDAVGLTPAERQVCDQALASRQVKIPPNAGLALPEGKQAAFDRAAAAKRAQWEERRANVPNEHAHPLTDSGRPDEPDLEPLPIRPSSR